MPKQNSINQNQRVLNHLIDHGYITEVVARNYGIRRLASRVHDLTKEGIPVARDMRFDDVGVRYTYYTLSELSREYEKNRRDDHGFTWRARNAA